MTPVPNMFVPAARVLHWLMAAMVLIMLFVGIGMVASVSTRHEWLVNLHKPLGIAILLLAAVRLVVRWRNPPPALPADLPALQKLAAYASHWLLYFLMLAAAERLGDAVCWRLPGDAQRVAAVATDFSDRSGRLCGVAALAYLVCAAAVGDVSGAHGCRAVSRADSP